MTGHFVLFPKVHHYVHQDWFTVCRHIVAMLATLWYVTKVVPVFVDVQLSLGTAGFYSAAFVGPVSSVATLCGALLPLCLGGCVVARILARCNPESWQRRCKLAFSGFLAAAILLPFVSLALSLLLAWL